MTVKEILVKWLKDNGYDGLYYDDADGCGCSIDNLIPCRQSCECCKPAYKVEPPEWAKEEGIEEWFSPTKEQLP